MEWRWLDADADGRDRLRCAFAVAQPDLIAEADDLAQASAGLHGFLETPAWRLAARSPDSEPGSSGALAAIVMRLLERRRPIAFRPLPIWRGPLNSVRSRWSTHR